MIEIRQIDTKSIDSLDKIIDWKKNQSLCDMIMSKSIVLSQQEAKKWVEDNSKHNEQEFLGIYLNNELSGIARLMFIDKYARTAEIGLYIGNGSRRGVGLGKETLEELIKIAKERRSLKKVYARIRKTNSSSLRLFKSIGFTEEGHLKDQYYSVHSESYDDIYYVALFI